MDGSNPTIIDAHEMIRFARHWRRRGCPKLGWPRDGYGRPHSESTLILAAMTYSEIARYLHEYYEKDFPDDSYPGIEACRRARLKALTRYLQPLH